MYIFSEYKKIYIYNIKVYTYTDKGVKIGINNESALFLVQ